MKAPSPEKQIIARETAKMLIEVEAILFNAEKPFIFTSGWASPVYTDMRKIISYPRLRTRLHRFRGDDDRARDRL